MYLHMQPTDLITILLVGPNGTQILLKMAILPWFWKKKLTNTKGQVYNTGNSLLFYIFIQALSLCIRKWKTVWKISF